MMGPGKTTYTFSVTFRFPLRLFSMLLAGGGGQAAEMESSLALAENVYVILPTPQDDIGGTAYILRRMYDTLKLCYTVSLCSAPRG